MKEHISIELANYVFSTAHRPHDFEQLIPRVYQAGPEMARIHRVAVAENSGTYGNCLPTDWSLYTLAEKFMRKSLSLPVGWETV